MNLAKSTRGFRGINERGKDGTERGDMQRAGGKFAQNKKQGPKRQAWETTLRGEKKRFPSQSCTGRAVAKVKVRGGRGEGKSGW